VVSRCYFNTIPNHLSYGSQLVARPPKCRRPRIQISDFIHSTTTSKELCVIYISKRYIDVV
jgi:hypothetical protein